MRKTLIAAVALVMAGCAPATDGAAGSDGQQSDPQAVVTSLYDAFAQGDMDAIGGLLGDDVTWREAEGGPYEFGNPYIGAEAVGSGVFGPIVGAYADFAATPEQYTVEGNRVVVEGRYTGTNRETGEALNAQFVHVYTIDGDTIESFQQYTDTFQWRRVEGVLGE